MTVEVCLTPDLINQFSLEGKIVVVIDIFRATSSMVTGLSNGVKAIYPVASVDACLAYGKKGMLTGGERGGKKLPEFDLGNSPFDYRSEKARGQEVSMTTTNGTRAIAESKNADEVVIGSFLNLSATLDYLKEKAKPLILHCAGWKGSVNLEDTLFAGALISRLTDYQPENDAALLALDFYNFNKENLLEVSKKSSHAKRLSGFGVDKDIAFCLKEDLYKTVVVLDNEKLVAL